MRCWCYQSSLWFERGNGERGGRWGQAHGWLFSALPAILSLLREKTKLLSSNLARGGKPTRSRRDFALMWKPSTGECRGASQPGVHLGPAVPAPGFPGGFPGCFPRSLGVCLLLWSYPPRVESFRLWKHVSPVLAARCSRGVGLALRFTRCRVYSARSELSGVLALLQALAVQGKWSQGWKRHAACVLAGLGCLFPALGMC